MKKRKFGIIKVALALAIVIGLCYGLSAYMLSGTEYKFDATVDTFVERCYVGAHGYSYRHTPYAHLILNVNGCPVYADIIDPIELEINDSVTLRFIQDKHASHELKYCTIIHDGKWYPVDIYMDKDTADIFMMYLESEGIEQ